MQTGPPEHTILLVDDEPDILSTMKAYLESTIEDSRVFTAESGDAALEILSREHVDVALVDQRMPNMEGLELLRRIEADHSEVVRFMVTAYPDMDLAIRACNEGRAKRFFTKPVDPHEVATVVQEALLSIQKARRQAEAAKRAARLARGTGGEGGAD